jgi:hypothetical protein
LGNSCKEKAQAVPKEDAGWKKCEHGGELGLGVDEGSDSGLVLPSQKRMGMVSSLGRLEWRCHQAQD